MQDFLTTHKKLRFLGLMHMDDCGLAMFTVPTHPLYNPDLVVSIIQISNILYYVFINNKLLVKCFIVFFLI